MVIGADLERYVSFEAVDDEQLAACPGFVKNRAADFSLIALVLRLERQGFSTYLIAKDRTLVQDLARAGSKGLVVPPTGFAEAIRVITPVNGLNASLADRIQNNAYVNLSRGMRLVKQTDGEAAYLDWQDWLNSRTAARHELIEAVKATGVRL